MDNADKQMCVEQLNSEMDLLEEAKLSLDAGELSIDEFEEIANDIVEGIDVDALAKKVDNKRVAKEAVDRLKQIVTTVISLAK